MLRQKSVLEFAADGHHLGKNLLHRFFVEVAVGQVLNRRDLLTFSFRIIHRFSSPDLILGHISADAHSLLKQTHDLAVDHIQFISALHQVYILHRVTSVISGIFRISSVLFSYRTSLIISMITSLV